MKRLVVIGGGFAGSRVAKTLEKDFEVTLIDEKDFFEYHASILSAVVEPETMKKIRELHSHYLKRAQIVTGKVTKISENEVFIGRKRIEYDYLVIATGSKYGFPFRGHDAIMTDRADRLREHWEQLQNAEKVLVIGGGVAGVEIAGEIVTKYPDKDTTVIHAMDRLLERQPQKVSDYAKKYLEKRGARIIFNELVKTDVKGEYTTDKGTKIRADIAFLCVGVFPDSDFMKKSFPQLLDERQRIKVNEFLQAEGYPNIFVGGDVTSINEEKTAQSAEQHSKIIIKNLRNTEKNRPLQKYVHKDRGMLVSLGDYNGIYVKGKFVLKGIIPRIMKRYVQFEQMKKV